MTVEAAVQDVVAKITAATIGRGDGQALAVQDFDPLPGLLDPPACVAVTFGTITDTEWKILVRGYFSATVDVQAAERLLRSVIPAVDAALDNVPAPRSAWSKVYAPDLSSYVVETTLDYPRDDF